MKEERKKIIKDFNIPYGKIEKFIDYLDRGLFRCLNTTLIILFWVLIIFVILLRLYY